MWKLNRANYSGSQDSADLANFNYFICSSAAKIFSQEFKTFNAMQAWLKNEKKYSAFISLSMNNMSDF